MTSFEELKKYALALEGSTEEPHFEKPSFRVNKKIFATYDAKKDLACVKLDLIDQSVFGAYDANIIYPVPNSWGKQGWTYIDLSKVKKTVLKDALKKSYINCLKAKK